MPIRTLPTWSRLIRFLASDGHTYLGEPIDPERDVGLAFAAGEIISAHVIDAIVPWDGKATRTGEVKTVFKLLSPVSAEMCGAIRATGLSYKDHAEEMHLPLPPVPVLFFKPSTTLADPSEVIPVPKVAQNDELDYEVELAIVIGRDAKNVKENEALEYVLGYTCANDLTARKHQETSSQWAYAKGFDKFCPLGPCLVSSRSLPDPHVVSLQTRLNGKLMQDGTAKKMIFPLAKVISYLSQGTLLKAGTVIITGTPPGIGNGRNPKVWLEDRDEVQCYISHGLGTLVNTIRYE
ncbi:MAG: hypothetical protein TREMPRED_001519 [Tremellales sp. Tagirdzhanova-0007]|nr:MAG: hypothetical protein TREMPRED_001519 [Tremellales sp. Tagirdzhanova-0007]